VRLSENETARIRDAPETKPPASEDAGA